MLAKPPVENGAKHPTIIIIMIIMFLYIYILLLLSLSPIIIIIITYCPMIIIVPLKGLQSSCGPELFLRFTIGMRRPVRADAVNNSSLFLSGAKWAVFVGFHQQSLWWWDMIGV